jgi:hypothetical protein
LNTNARHRSRLCGFCLLAIAFFIAARSTDAQNPNQDFLRLRARAQSIQVPGDTLPAPRWVIINPASAEVHVQDPDLRDAIVRSLQDMAAENHPWVARGTAWNFFGQIVQRVSSKVSGSFNIAPPSAVLKPATPENSEVNDLWKITYLPEVIRSLQVVVATAEAQKNAAAASKETKSMADAAAAFGIGNLTEQEKQIPLTIEYATGDLSAKVGESPDAVKSAVEKELLKIAGYSFLTAKSGGLVLGQKLPQNRSTIEDQIQNTYTAAKIQNWPSPKATIRQLAQGTGAWILTVGNARLVGDVKIKVEPIKLEQQLKDKGQTDDANKLEKRRKEIEADYNARYTPRLLAQPHEAPTKSEIDKDTSLLAQVSDVADVTLTAEGSTLIFDINRRLQIASLSVKGGVGYSPEDSFTGLAQVSASNLLHLNETFSLSFTGGNEVLRGNVSFSFYYEEPQRKQYFRSFDLNGKFFRDRNQRLGNTQGPKLEDMESSGQAKFSTGYDSFTPRDYILRAEGIDKNRKRVRYGMKVDAVFDYKGVTIQPRVQAAAPVAEGQVAAASLLLDQGVSLDLRKTPVSRVGEIDAFVTTTAKRAFDFLGADFPFDQFTVNIGGQLFFGPTSPTDIFLRFNSEVGVSSSRTPVFEQFRLGGPNNVRGLEEGEFIGRNMNFERAELGFKSTYLLNLFKRKADQGAAAKPAPTVGGIDLSNTYLKTFYDWGRVTNKTSIADLFKLASGVQGIGIGIELRGLNVGGKRASLTIGYAYSHDSLLHKSGVLVTGLSLDR